MTEKKFTIHNSGLQGQFIKESGEFLTVDMVCEMLNDFYEENEQLKQFKELLCAVLKQEYEDRTNEMNRWAEKEDWNGYRATKLEYGTVIRIAKRIGVDLE